MNAAFSSLAAKATHRSRSVLLAEAEGSPLFHLGAFMVIAGHAVCLAMVTGLGMLCAGRLLTRRIRLTTDRGDKLLFPLLSATVLLGITATAAHNVFGPGYDYRETVSVWFRGLFVLQPQPEAIAGAPLLFRLHALTAGRPRSASGSRRTV